MKKNKQLLIFFSIVIIMPVVLGIFMKIGFDRGQDVSLFPLVWMYLPASAAMTAMLAGRRRAAASGNREDHDGGENDTKPAVMPAAFFLTFIVITAAMAVLTILNVFLPTAGLGAWVNILVYASCLISFLLMVCLKKKSRDEYGLLLTKNWKKGIAGVLLFILLYLFLSVVSVALSGGMEELAINPQLPLYITVLLPVSLVMSFTAFFGEEYGWRFFLQPALQERFGLRRGVIFLGIFWGLWHLPINLLYYSPQTALQSVLVQLAGCVGMGIFFGWVYMRSQNIWAVTLIHFLNNNLGLAIFSATAASVVWSWRDTVITILCFAAVYLPFLLTGEYRKKETAGSVQN